MKRQTSQHSDYIKSRLDHVESENGDVNLAFFIVKGVSFQSSCGAASVGEYSR